MPLCRKRTRRRFVKACYGSACCSPMTWPKFGWLVIEPFLESYPCFDQIKYAAKQNEPMEKFMNCACKLVALVSIALPLTCAAQEWITLFDGKTLNGWQPSENKNSWRVEAGALVSKG